MAECMVQSICVVRNSAPLFRRATVVPRFVFSGRFRRFTLLSALLLGVIACCKSDGRQFAEFHCVDIRIAVMGACARGSWHTPGARGCITTSLLYDNSIAVTTFASPPFRGRFQSRLCTRSSHQAASICTDTVIFTWLVCRHHRWHDSFRR